MSSRRTQESSPGWHFQLCDPKVTLALSGPQIPLKSKVKNTSLETMGKLWDSQ